MDVPDDPGDGRWRRVTVAGAAALLGGWLAFDGVRALAVGDYVTPAAGDHTGRLGPWADLLGAVGIDPRSTAVKTLHVALGAAWLAGLAGYLARSPRGRPALVACAALSLWYLPFGTLLAGLVIALLARRPS